MRKGHLATRRLRSRRCRKSRRVRAKENHSIGLSATAAPPGRRRHQQRGGTLRASRHCTPERGSCCLPARHSLRDCTDAMRMPRRSRAMAERQRSKAARAGGSLATWIVPSPKQPPPPIATNKGRTQHPAVRPLLSPPLSCGRGRLSLSLITLSRSLALLAAALRPLRCLSLSLSVYTRHRSRFSAPRRFFASHRPLAGHTRHMAETHASSTTPVAVHMCGARYCVATT